MVIENQSIRIELLENSSNLWNYWVKSSGRSFSFAGPTFEVENASYESRLKNIHLEGSPRVLNNGCKEYVFTGDYFGKAGLYLKIIYRIAEDNPIIRFKYILYSKVHQKMTKVQGKDNLTYVSASFSEFHNTREIRWLQAGSVEGDVNTLAKAYRTFNQQRTLL